MAKWKCPECEYENDTIKESYNKKQFKCKKCGHTEFQSTEKKDLSGSDFLLGGFEFVADGFGDIVEIVSDIVSDIDISDIFD